MHLPWCPALNDHPNGTMEDALDLIPAPVFSSRTPFEWFGRQELQGKAFYCGAIKSPQMEETVIAAGLNQLPNKDKFYQRNRERCFPLKKPIQRYATLFCYHCRSEFRAKPTFRKEYDHWVVNHKCTKYTKRVQYVIGLKQRKCKYGCSSRTGCVSFLRVVGDKRSHDIKDYHRITDEVKFCKWSHISHTRKPLFQEIDYNSDHDVIIQ